MGHPTVDSSRGIRGPKGVKSLARASTSTSNLNSSPDFGCPQLILTSLITKLLGPSACVSPGPVSQSGNIRNTHRWIGFDWILAAGTVTTNQNPAQNRAREPRRAKQNVNFQISVGTEISR